MKKAVLSKKAVLEIKYCNSSCPFFYFNCDDLDNVWCSKLGKKIFNPPGLIVLGGDTIQRKIPRNCPLEDWNEPRS